MGPRPGSRAACLEERQATQAGRRKMVVHQVHAQEDGARCAEAASPAEKAGSVGERGERGERTQLKGAEIKKRKEKNVLNY